MADGGAYRLWRGELITDLLRHEPPAVAAAVLDAVERLLEQPRGTPEGITVYPTRGRTARRLPGSFMAKLPHGFVLTFTPLENVPPLGSNMLRVDAFVREVSHG